MSAARPPAPPHWLAYVAIATLVLGIVLQAGISLARVDSIDVRVTKIEARGEQLRAARDEQIHSIDMRTTRIETKLDDLRGKP